ncbi:Transcription elongation regulator 1 [Papilio machaon]|uniref:Transcription elongation regulator 1 n=1 Tax=Papilio machaon TaxID=76193 RepID=A0A0N1IPW7_PAPMA|nr:Transcription elongation regulator 1 [Papilio machaon]
MSSQTGWSVRLVVHFVFATNAYALQKTRTYYCVHFNALLADLVRNPDLTWREAKKQLKKDHRYKLAELLSKEDKERLFSQHISVLSNKRRDKLRALLTELGVTSTARWRDVKDQLQQQPAPPVYASASQVEKNRYTALDHAPGERLQTIMAHLEELHKKGPPPPPTASEPTRRPK